MTTLSETETTAPRSGHLRAYLAGTGATGALVAGVIIVFLSLATYVAFKGLPFGGNGDNSGTEFVGVGAGGAPTAAATALAAAPGAVAASPVPGAPIGAGAAGAVPDATLAAALGGGGDAGFGGPGTDGTLPPGVEPPPPGPGPGPGPAPEPAPTPGVVGNTIDGVDDTAGTDLSGPTGGVTDTVDGTVTDKVNDVGGVVGQDGLGDRVNDRVNGTVDGLLGK